MSKISCMGSLRLPERAYFTGQRVIRRAKQRVVQVKHISMYSYVCLSPTLALVHPRARAPSCKCTLVLVHLRGNCVGDIWPLHRCSSACSSCAAGHHMSEPVRIIGIGLT